MLFVVTSHNYHTHYIIYYTVRHACDPELEFDQQITSQEMTEIQAFYTIASTLCRGKWQPLANNSLHSTCLFATHNKSGCLFELNYSIITVFVASFLFFLFFFLPYASLLMYVLCLIQSSIHLISSIYLLHSLWNQNKQNEQKTLSITSDECLPAQSKKTMKECLVKNSPNGAKVYNQCTTQFGNVCTPNNEENLTSCFNTAAQNLTMNDKCVELVSDNTQKCWSSLIKNETTYCVERKNLQTVSFECKSLYV